MPERAKPCGEHSERFFSPSRLKFASDEIRTQDLLGARRYRAGLANSTARPFTNKNSIIDSCTWKIIFLHRIFMLLCSLSPWLKKDTSLTTKIFSSLRPELPSFQLHLKCLIKFISNVDQFFAFFSAISTYASVPDISPRLSDHIPVGNLICFSFCLYSTPE